MEDYLRKSRSVVFQVPQNPLSQVGILIGGSNVPYPRGRVVRTTYWIP